MEIVYFCRKTAMISRIQEIMQEKNLSPSQFAEEIGVQRSGISHILSGRNKPSLEFILKILNRFPEVNSAWLLFGKYQEEEKEHRRETKVEHPISEISKPDMPETEPIFAENKIQEDKKIEKILVFYQDRSFREYYPEQEE